MGIGSVQDFNPCAEFFILLSMFFSSLLHLFNLLVAQAGRGLNPDTLLFIGTLILRTHIQHAVCIHIKGHFNLGYATRCRRDTVQVKAAQRPVVSGSCPLTLQNMNFNAALVVSCRGEYFRDRKSTRLNSSHVAISYAVFCLKKKK